eukprot:CAMPEP_0185261314 /NCGR_PEP_ID=MMETSP1359-20130426/9720_1 /TAXON_ID=552665 /ORGANISM="Bigelowiella longifila, Strain CCMP242" /LENGTH=35 /DNA_ID= /DNA_START= /DNA_END= /DNA_ORIENTATION=
MNDLEDDDRGDETEECPVVPCPDARVEVDAVMVEV